MVLADAGYDYSHPKTGDAIGSPEDRKRKGRGRTTPTIVAGRTAPADSWDWRMQVSARVNFGVYMCCFARHLKCAKYCGIEFRWIGA